MRWVFQLLAIGHVGSAVVFFMGSKAQDAIYCLLMAIFLQQEGKE